MSSDSPRIGERLDHSRSHSRPKVLPRRPTKGPLEDSDPLEATGASGHDVEKSPPPVQSRLSTSSRTESQSPAPSVNLNNNTKKDFSFLQRREIFQPLQHLGIPESYKRADAELDRANTSLVQLLSTGRFRNAAILAVELLTAKTDPQDHEQIFLLFYVRLVCLQLLGLHSFASHEVKALQDLGSAIYRDPINGSHLVPWELRVLVIRLQAIGYSDWRRGIMSYYGLAREARSEARQSSEEVHAKWKNRLQDLGIRVACALVERNDLEGAVRHLQSLPVPGVDDDTLKLRKALLYLRAGDVRAAEQQFSTQDRTDENTIVQGTFRALCKMAQDDFENAIEHWKQVEEAMTLESKVTTLARQNIAVCLVYCGRIIESRAILEDLTSHAVSNHGVLFNLCTVYELSSDRARDLKLDLSRETASHTFSTLGWEYLNVDFKL